MTTSADFTRMKLAREMMYTLVSKYTCLRLQQVQKHLFFACYSSLAAQAKNILLYLCSWSSEGKYLVCRSSIYLCKYTSLLTGGSWTGIGGFVKRILKVWRFSDIIRCPAGHRTAPGWSPLKSYDLNFKPKSSGALPMCANAGRIC